MHVAAGEQVQGKVEPQLVDFYSEANQQARKKAGLSVIDAAPATSAAAAAAQRPMTPKAGTPRGKPVGSDGLGAGELVKKGDTVSVRFEGKVRFPQATLQLRI